MLLQPLAFPQEGVALPYGRLGGVLATDRSTIVVFLKLSSQGYTERCGDVLQWGCATGMPQV